MWSVFSPEHNIEHTDSEQTREWFYDLGKPYYNSQFFSYSIAGRDVFMPRKQYEARLKQKWTHYAGITSSITVKEASRKMPIF